MLCQDLSIPLWKFMWKPTNYTVEQSIEIHYLICANYIIKYEIYYFGHGAECINQVICGAKGVVSKILHTHSSRR